MKCLFSHRNRGWAKIYFTHQIRRVSTFWIILTGIDFLFWEGQNKIKMHINFAVSFVFCGGPFFDFLITICCCSSWVRSHAFVFLSRESAVHKGIMYVIICTRAYVWRVYSSRKDRSRIHYFHLKHSNWRETLRKNNGQDYLDYMLWNRGESLLPKVLEKVVMTSLFHYQKWVRSYLIPKRIQIACRSIPPG